MSACEFAAEHHSADVVEVFYGAVTPMVLCGYHASEGWLSVAVNSVSRSA